MSKEERYKNPMSLQKLEANRDVIDSDMKKFYGSSIFEVFGILIIVTIISMALYNIDPFYALVFPIFSLFLLYNFYPWKGKKSN
ncbi:MAG: hypothetical protein INQ03_23510 [Candidatus Heimdallarchaeota archaeon]|nr:hypothetical protein [Candidatus Heimdallarchaeota archaeon]